MKSRSEKELEQLSQRILATGTKVCPDCGKTALTLQFDANYTKIRCGACDFKVEEYFGG